MDKLPLITRLARNKRVTIRDLLKKHDEQLKGIVRLEQFKATVASQRVKLTEEDYKYLLQLYGEGRSIYYIKALRHLKLSHSRERDSWYIYNDLKPDSPTLTAPSYLSAVKSVKGKDNEKIARILSVNKVLCKDIEGVYKRIRRIEKSSGDLGVHVFKALVGRKLNDFVKEELGVFLMKSTGKIDLSKLSDLVKSYKTWEEGVTEIPERVSPEDYYLQYTHSTHEQLKRDFSFEIQKRIRNISSAFIYFDLDNDGVLSLDDFLTVSGYLSLATSETEVKSFFHYLDRGSKGYLVFREFSEIFDTVSCTPSSKKISLCDTLHLHRRICREFSSSDASKSSFRSLQSYSMGRNSSLGQSIAKKTNLIRKNIFTHNKK